MRLIVFAATLVLVMSGTPGPGEHDVPTHTPLRVCIAYDANGDLIGECDHNNRIVACYKADLAGTIFAKCGE